jgi:hypothetical protein
MRRMFMTEEPVGLKAREGDAMADNQGGLKAREDSSMIDVLKARLSELREITPRLDAATDRASEVVAKVERYLVYELGVEVSARVYLGEDRYLAFGPVDDEHQIHIVVEGPFQERRVEWPSCSRELKLKAFDKVPALLEKIFQEADRLAEEAETTACHLDEMLGDTA